MNEVINAIIPYFHLSKAIIEREDVANSDNSSRDDIKTAKEEIAALERKFNEDADNLVFEILKNFKKGDERKLDEFFKSILDSVKQVIIEDNGDEAELNLRAIDRTTEKLVALAAKQQKKSPARRRIEHYGIFVFLGVVVAIYFGVRLFSALPTYDVVETRGELLAAYDVVKKVERYDDWASARVRKGGWLKGIMLWPIEPTGDEIAFAGEYLSLVVAVHDYGQQEGIFCDRTIFGSLGDADIDKEVEYLHLVGDFAENADPDVSAVVITAEALSRRFPCD